LFVTNQDPLQFYKAIASFSSTHLKPKGSVFVEVNQQFAAETKALFAEAGWDTELRKDMYGNQRMLKATKKSLPN
jgi:release factor glutamine methyltransferase